MSAKNSLSSFDQLATEIFFEIFDYLSCNDIIYTFFYLNRRFNSILLQHSRFLNNFITPTSNFNFWQSVLPIIGSHIECLVITTTDYCFSFDLFSNLKSLIISSSLPIFHDELTLILKCKQFKKLNTFKIRSEIVNRGGSHEIFLLHKILHDDNSLHTFESLQEKYEPYFENINKPYITMNLQSLSLKIPDFDYLFSLFSFTPNLKYLNIRLTILLINNQSSPNIDLSKIKLKKFSIALQYGINQRSFLFLAWFINQFSSSLNYLSLNLYSVITYRYHFNGFTLQKQFLESMIQLKSFHLYTQLNTKLINVEDFLSTFQTQFWFDHHWTFGIYENYLYTLPFHFDELTSFIDFNQMKSSNSMILNSPKTWSYVKSIDASTSSTFSLNLIKQLKLKIPNLTSIAFSFRSIKNLFTSVDDTNQIDITLDSVTTVRCESADLQFIKQCLKNIFPNTRKLILSCGPYWITSSLNRTEFLQKLDEYFNETDYIYLSKIEYAKIKLQFNQLDHMYEHVIRFIEELLAMFRNLQCFILHFYQNGEFPRCHPITDLSTMIDLLSMEKILEKYQMKQTHNHLEFVKNKKKT